MQCEGTSPSGLPASPTTRPGLPAGRGSRRPRPLAQHPLAAPRERTARRPGRVTGRGEGAREGREPAQGPPRRAEIKAGRPGGWRDLRILLLISRVCPEAGIPAERDRYGA